MLSGWLQVCKGASDVAGTCRPTPCPCLRAAYTRLLGFINSAAVSKNRAEKAINSILDKAGEGAEVGGIYSVTLATLSGAAVGGSGGNERLLFKTRMKLGRVLLARAAYAELAALVAQLEDSVAAQGGLQGALASGPPGGGGGGWMGWGHLTALLCCALTRLCRSDGCGGLRCRRRQGQGDAAPRHLRAEDPDAHGRAR